MTHCLDCAKLTETKICAACRLTRERYGYPLPVGVVGTDYRDKIAVIEQRCNERKKSHEAII